MTWMPRQSQSDTGGLCWLSDGTVCAGKIEQERVACCPCLSSAAFSCCQSWMLLLYKPTSEHQNTHSQGIPISPISRSKDTLLNA